MRIPIMWKREIKENAFNIFWIIMFFLLLILGGYYCYRVLIEPSITNFLLAILLVGCAFRGLARGIYL